MRRASTSGHDGLHPYNRGSIRRMAFQALRGRGWDAMNKAKTAMKGDDERLEALVRTRTDELSGLASHLQGTHEEQNRKLARELHDELGSLLTAAKLDITFVKSKCAKVAPDLVAKCDRIASMIDQATALKR